MGRLIDAEATKLAICRDECGADAEECSRMCCRFPDVIDEMPTAFDVEILMKKLATLDRIAKSDKQKALLGRVFFIIENMIEENEKEQKNDTDSADSEIHDGRGQHHGYGCYP